MATGGWRTAGGSVTGSMHERNQQSNEDAWSTVDHDDFAIVVVADGHGSRRCFRSDRGARFATSVVSDALTADLADNSTASLDADALVELLRTRAGPRVVDGWRDLVEADVAADPISDGDWETAQIDPVKAGHEAVLLAYGTTFVAMCATDHLLAAMQLGDGDAVVVHTDGTVWQPLPTDPDLAGNLTDVAGATGSSVVAAGRRAEPRRAPGVGRVGVHRRVRRGVHLFGLVG